MSSGNIIPVGVHCHPSRLMASLGHHDPVCEASPPAPLAYSRGAGRSCPRAAFRLCFSL